MRFRGLDLNLLVALDVLFEEMNVTRAATRLSMEQSTLSGALRRLRTHFKDQLLIPHGRALHKTPLAVQLERPLREAVLRLESLVATDGIFNPKTAKRHFKVEFPDRLVPVLLPNISKRLLPYAPNILVQFVQPKGDPAPLLHRGQLDLVITPDVYEAEGYPSIDLMHDKMVVVGWTENEAMRQPISTERLARTPLVKMDFDAVRLVPFMSSEEIQLIQGTDNIAMYAPTFGSIPEMLIGSNAVAILHCHLAEKSAQHLPLSIQPLPFPSPVLTDVLMFHPTRTEDGGLQWLIDQFLKAADHFRAPGRALDGTAP